MENIEKNLHIPELYELNHRNDNNLNVGYNYQDNLLKDNLSRVLFKNNITNGFLLKLQKLIVYGINTNVVTRNWFNYTVDKYYNKHSN